MSLYPLLTTAYDGTEKPVIITDHQTVTAPEYRVQVRRAMGWMDDMDPNELRAYLQNRNSENVNTDGLAQAADTIQGFRCLDLAGVDPQHPHAVTPTWRARAAC